MTESGKVEGNPIIAVMTRRQKHPLRALTAEEQAEMAYQRLHSTSTMAAQVALGAGVKQLIMTHFSPRYAPGNAIGLNDLLQEARAIFPNTIMAYDFLVHEIPKRAEELVAATVS